MQSATQNRITISDLKPDDYYLYTWIEAFLIDRKVRGLTRSTLIFYRSKLTLFAKWCDGQVVTQVTEITANVLRRYMVVLGEEGHNPGGILAVYRALRAFLRWWGDEVEPENWRNPIKRVKAPKVPIEPIEPVELDTVRAMLDTCERDYYGLRDQAIFLALMDTGARAQELLDINLEDVNLATGAILIRSGKGRKPRTVYLGKQSRKALRAYLRKRKDKGGAVWVTMGGKRLTYDGLSSWSAIGQIRQV